MKYNQPVEPLLEQVKPSIEYYKKTAESYVGKKKKMRKMRYASYYNIAYIYYFLDQLDKAAEYAQKIIDNDYSEKKGKRLLSSINDLKNLFEANKVKTRHFEVITEDLTSSDNTGFNDEIETPKISHTKYRPNLVPATVITNRNETVKGFIDLNQFKNYRMNGKISLVISKKDGKTVNRVFTTSITKLITFENGDKYKPVAFREGGEMTPYAPKRFVYVLFESDKIQLYKYTDKELVIKKPQDKKGISNQSMGFVMNLKKQLKKFADNCEPVINAIDNKEFTNNRVSLMDFCQRVTSCE
jgi:hypothetical protein